MDAVISALLNAGISVLQIGENDYERSVATSNLLYRFFRPGCVVQPTQIVEVETVIRVAKSHDIAVTTKNGGHSYTGSSIAKDGISLDLSRLKDVTVDMDAETMTLQGGALWGHAYKALVNGSHSGYLVNGGRCATVGVSGFILGGGLGPFTRSFGMGCDALKEATIVTADARTVTVRDTDKRTTKEGRLFWALCGAGGGNFGVVVEMKLKLQRQSNEDGLVVSGQYTWYPKPDDAAMKEFMETMDESYSEDWPDQITIDSTWRCEPSRTDSELGVEFFIHYDGDKIDFDQLIDDSIRQADLAKQLKRRSLAEVSTLYLHESLVTQWAEETTRAFPTNPSYRIYSSFAFGNDKATISNITSAVREEMKAFREQFSDEQALLEVTWIHGGGKATKKRAAAATAFPWRSGVYYVYVMVRWQAKWLEHDMRQFLRQFRTKLRSYSINGLAAFVNFPDETLCEHVYERAYYGDNHVALRKVKRLWDKDNFFNWDQGIRLPQPYPDTGAAANDQGTAQPDDATHCDDVVSLDSCAGQQWEYFEPPPGGGVLNFDITGGGPMVRTLTDLGF
ncbi:hypothetical protein F5X97DRAFT_323269 [Nemania serpens]|nr:hypothetical protein F5X97DRAFT_323269 [Nemania serpens]